MLSDTYLPLAFDRLALLLLLSEDFLLYQPQLRVPRLLHPPAHIRGQPLDMAVVHQEGLILLERLRRPRVQLQQPRHGDLKGFGVNLAEVLAPVLDSSLLAWASQARICLSLWSHDPMQE